MYDTVLNGAEILKCITIGGAASGGNCAKVAGWVLAAQAGLEARHRIDEALLDAKSRAEEAAKVRFAELEHDATMKELMLDLDSTVTSVYSHISEFETVMQQLFNIDVRIADTHYLAERAAERYAENLDWQAQRMERLSGWKSSDVLRRNAEVSAANTALRGALITSYELVQAMRYDLNATEDAILSARDGQNNPLSFNGVYKLSTLQDFDWFLSSIDDLNEKRCVVLQRSGQGDCQSEADERQYSVSLQKLLFPDLHDIIDSSTGRVLTEGHQFHQRITSPEFLRKRPRGNGFVWQIELPFGIWPQELARLKAEASDQDNISSGQCNLRIRQNGISMKAVGSLLAPNLTVKLFRGGTDYQRSCYEPGGTDDAIKSYKVSWVPGADAERDAEPFQSFVIFQGVTSPGAPVFLNRFQDRSLAAPDYVLVIELTENQPPTDHWLFKATAGGQMPVLEDLRLTFKYRAVDFQ